MPASSPPPLCSPKNSLFSLLFLLPFLLLLYHGGAALSSLLSEENGDSYEVVSIDEDGKTEGDEEEERDSRVLFVVGLCVMMVISSLWSILSVYLTLFLITQIVKVIFVMFILFSVFGGVFKFADGGELLGVTLMICALLAVLFFFTIRKKVEFVGANLRIACAALLSTPTVVYAIVGTLCVFFFWVIFWSASLSTLQTNKGSSTIIIGGEAYSLSECTTYEVGHHALANYTDRADLPSELEECHDQDGCSTCFCGGEWAKDDACYIPSYSSLGVIGYMLCLYYVGVVLSNAVHCCGAMVVTTWWRSGSTSSSAVVEAYKASFSRWLGPIAVASLLVPPIRMLHSVVHSSMLLLDIDVATGRPNNSEGSTRRSYSPYVLKLGDALFNSMNVLENSVISFNRFAFGYLVSNPPQYDFSEASQSVAELFARRGFVSLVHDTVLENLLVLASASSGIILLLLGTFYAEMLQNDFEGNINEVLPLCCFLLGFLSSWLALQVVLGAASAACVCLAETPDCLQTHHPEYFEPFVSAWRKEYPEANITFSLHAAPPAGSSPSAFVYVPPSPLSSSGNAKMGTQTHSTSAPKSQSTSQVKYHKLEKDCDDSGSDEDRKQEEVDEVLESYAASQLPVKPGGGIKLFSSPSSSAGRSKPSSNMYDDQDDEFVL